MSRQSLAGTALRVQLLPQKTRPQFETPNIPRIVCSAEVRPSPSVLFSLASIRQPALDHETICWQIVSWKQRNTLRSESFSKHPMTWSSISLYIAFGTKHATKIVDTRIIAPTRLENLPAADYAERARSASSGRGAAPSANSALQPRPTGLFSSLDFCAAHSFFVRLSIRRCEPNSKAVGARGRR